MMGSDSVIESTYVSAVAHASLLIFLTSRSGPLAWRSDTHYSHLRCHLHRLSLFAEVGHPAQECCSNPPARLAGPSSSVPAEPGLTKDNRQSSRLHGVLICTAPVQKHLRLRETLTDSTVCIIIITSENSSVVV